MRPFSQDQAPAQPQVRYAESSLPSVGEGTPAVTEPAAENSDQPSIVPSPLMSPVVKMVHVSEAKELGKMTKIKTPAGDSEYLFEYHPMRFVEEQLEKLKRYREKYGKLDTKKQVVL